MRDPRQAGVMVGAVITHATIGGSAAIPIVLFIALGAVVYLRRNQLPSTPYRQ